MSLKNLCVGFALAVGVLVLTPTSGFANHGGNNSRNNRSEILDKLKERTDAYRDRFGDMRKDKKHRGYNNNPVGVPELDPNGVAAAATLLLGGVLVVQGRRRRLALA